MKYMKFIVPLAIVILMLMIALPVAADDPFGGPPSRTSGNGATTWAAIYLSGYTGGVRDAMGYQAAPGCSTTPFAAGSSKWFKFDTHKSYDAEIYVDDEPKYGAALDYFGFGGQFHTGEPSKTLGNDNDPRAGGQQPIPFRVGWKPDGTQEPGNIQGFGATVYGSNNLQPDFYWPTPNNMLLTTRDGSRARVSDTEGSYGGFNRGGFSTATFRGQGSSSWDAAYAASTNTRLRHYAIKMADGNTHLLSGNTRDDGWVYIRVSNSMIWDNSAKVCVNLLRRAEYDFPNNTPGVPAFKTVP